MFTTATVIEAGLLAASLAATAASTGMSYYGQQQQASNAQAIANYNAAAQRQNADIQARLAQQQSTWNQQSLMAQYQARQNNAITLDNQARGEEARGRVLADQMRDKGDKAIATARAALAKSGVNTEGTPLLKLVDTAKNAELGVQDVAYQTELASQQWQQKAADERFQSGFSLMDASIERYKQSSIAIGQRIAYRDADLTKMQGAAQAQGYQTAAGATLLSGAASMAKTGFDDYYRLPSYAPLKTPYAAG